MRRLSPFDSASSLGFRLYFRMHRARGNSTLHRDHFTGKQFEKEPFCGRSSTCDSPDSLTAALVGGLRKNTPIFYQKYDAMKIEGKPNRGGRAQAWNRGEREGRTWMSNALLLKNERTFLPLFLCLPMNYEAKQKQRKETRKTTTSSSTLNRYHRNGNRTLAKSNGEKCWNFTEVAKTAFSPVYYGRSHFGP